MPWRVPTQGETQKHPAARDLIGGSRTLGCDIAQGYCIGRPMSVSEITPWLAVGNAERGLKGVGFLKVIISVGVEANANLE